MTFQPPNNNLNPESQEWRRWVERTLLDISTANTSGDQTTAMALAGINASIGRLSETQSNLATAVNDLAIAQGQITTLLSDQVEVVTLSAYQSGTTFTTYPTFTDYATVTATTPSGYANASIMAVSSFVMSGLSSGSWNPRTRIGSTTSQAVARGGLDASTNLSSSVGSLTGGQTITISSQVSGSVSGATVAQIYVYTSAIVVFTK